MLRPVLNTKTHKIYPYLFILLNPLNNPVVGTINFAILRMKKLLRKSLVTCLISCTQQVRWSWYLNQSSLASEPFLC